ncbi:MAG: AMP-binding protein [Bacteroidales bacterium]|nr:AMP-binding protein [Bacteroidales bacterium]
MAQFDFLRHIITNCIKHPDRNAFFIKDTYYSYGELSGLIAEIQYKLFQSEEREDHIGVYLGDDIQTYASILALWLSGHAFIPVNPQFPVERNRNIIDQLNLRLILHSKEIVNDQLISGCRTVFTGDMNIHSDRILEFAEFSKEKDAYVLFTSGSTGIPKGVRISVNNLNAFIRDFIGFPGYSFTPDDRFLQMYDLSFDGSIPCYVVPLVVGACIYTVPVDSIKYLAAYKLMQDHKLTFVKMPPSTLSYLRPYFSSIRLTGIKYCLLGGEAFPSMLAVEWEKCVPNALIQNVYGPTEATIISLIYDWNSLGSGRKENYGIVSVGKVFGSNKVLVIREDGQHTRQGETGELVIAGGQLSPGYWRNPELNERSFIEMEYNGKPCRFYRTGDLVSVDEQGNMMYLRRNDEQIQVQGYRVELGEIEAHAREYMKGTNVMAAGKDSGTGEMRICLFIESKSTDFSPLHNHLKKRLPHYMIPSEMIAVREFPKLVSGKLDRKALIDLLQ